MRVEDWLARSQNGYGELSEGEKSALADFAIVWSVFEAKVMASLGAAPEESLNVQRIAAYVDNNVQRLGDRDFLQRPLEYFTNRYVENGIANARFKKLNFRKNDRRDLVVEVLTGHERRPAETLKALMAIVFRLRNNLFHGVKWAGQMKDQGENFINAVHVITGTLDRFDN